MKDSSESCESQVIHFNNLLTYMYVWGFRIHIFYYCSNTFSVYCVSFSALGDSVCGICVFRCRLWTKVHCCHSAGVSDHFIAAVAVPAQTQQEADFLLLASHCGWRFTAQRYNIDINIMSFCSPCETRTRCCTCCIFFKFLFFTCSLLFSSLQDVFNSVFAAVYFIVLSMMALTTYAFTGTMVGGVRNISYLFNL